MDASKSFGGANAAEVIYNEKKGYYEWSNPRCRPRFMPIVDSVFRAVETDRCHSVSWKSLLGITLALLNTDAELAREGLIHFVESMLGMRELAQDSDDTGVILTDTQCEAYIDDLITCKNELISVIAAGADTSEVAYSASQFLECINSCIFNLRYPANAGLHWNQSVQDSYDCRTWFFGDYDPEDPDQLRVVNDHTGFLENPPDLQAYLFFDCAVWSLPTETGFYLPHLYDNKILNCLADNEMERFYAGGKIYFWHGEATSGCCAGYFIMPSSSNLFSIPKWGRDPYAVQPLIPKNEMNAPAASGLFSGALGAQTPYQQVQALLESLQGKEEFLLSKDSFLGMDGVEALLKEGIGQRSVHLTELLVEPEQGRLIGKAECVTLQQIQLHDVRLTLSAKADKQGMAQLELEIQSGEAAQDPFGGLKRWFTFTNEQYVYTFRGKEDRIVSFGTCLCGLKLSDDTAIPVKLLFSQNAAYLTLMTDHAEQERMNASNGARVNLEDAIGLLGVEGAENVLPAELRGLLEKLTVDSFFLEYEAARDRITHISFALAAENVLWSPAEGFQAELTGLRLDTYSSMDGKIKFTVSVSGTFRLEEELTVPVQIGFSNTGKQVFLQIGGTDSVCLGSLASLASFVGKVDTSVLPVQARAFYLDKLSFSYSLEEKKTTQFFLEISIQEVWDLLGLFQAEQLVFCVSVDDGGTDYRLLGDFRIASAAFQLTAEHGAEGWTLYGSTNPGQEVILAELVCAVAGRDDLASLPDFWLKHLRFYCKPGDSSYELEGTAGVSFDQGGSRLRGLCATFGLRREPDHTCFGLSLEGSFDFSALPFVGGAAKGMDETAISRLAFFYADKPVTNISVPGMTDPITAQAGLFFLLELDLPGGSVSCCLPLYTASEETRCAAVNSSLGFHGSIAVNKSVGPFSMRRLLLSYKDGTLGIGFCASFELGGLSLSLDELLFTYGLEDGEAHASLAGMSLLVQASAFSLEGGFLREDTETGRYSGSVRAQIGLYGLTLYGAYEAKPYPSAFLFGMLRGNIGGPPCFLVNGIAAGFGCARTLLVPSVDALEDFPLMAVLSGKQSAESILREADRVFPAKTGANWFAAGITASSFQMVDFTLLATVLLDQGFCLNLLGCAELRVPKGTADPIAQAGLLVKVAIDPGSGVIPVEGVLTQDSYVISKDCHISGGFACYFWYGGEHAGDFVLTFGGYRNGYAKPAHYPSPDRLKLSWKLSRELSAEGNLYFALTPSCIMAGGDFQMVFQWKCVYAWFHAYTDIMIGWKPYSYDFTLGISLRVKVNLKLFHIDLELGCDLSIWGPDFSGRANIHLWIISFSIAFGAGERKKELISTGEFCESFLPKPEETRQLRADASQFGPPTIHLASGVTNSHQQDAETSVNIANGQQLVLMVKSSVPLTASTLNGKAVQDGEASLYLRPCGKETAPRLIVEIRRCDGKPVSAEWEAEAVREAVPTALWAAETQEGETVLRCTGLSIRTAQDRPYRSLTCQLGCREEEAERRIPTAPELASPDYDQAKGYEILGQINAPKTAEKRNQFLDGIPGFAEEIDLAEWGDPQTVFRTKPILKGTGGKWHG